MWQQLLKSSRLIIETHKADDDSEKEASKPADDGKSILKLAMTPQKKERLIRLTRSGKFPTLGDMISLMVKLYEVLLTLADENGQIAVIKPSGDVVRITIHHNKKS